MVEGVGRAWQPMPELIPKCRLVAGGADQNRRNQGQRDPGRAAAGNLPPDRKCNDRQGGKRGHEPRQGNRRRHRENGEGAAEQPKPHQHVRTRPTAIAAAYRRSRNRTDYDRNQGGREGRGQCGVNIHWNCSRRGAGQRPVRVHNARRANVDVRSGHHSPWNPNTMGIPYWSQRCSSLPRPATCGRSAAPAPRAAPRSPPRRAPR